MRTEHPNASCNVERPVVSLRTVIIAVGAAQFMLPFMLSGAGPLLPAIGRDLHASAMQLSLINAAYTLSLAIFHLVAGRVGDMVGRKRLFLSGLSLFVVMSALLPFVTNIWLFLCCRFVQAMGTAIMNTCALAILVSCAPPEQLGRVLGLTSIGVYSGLSLGPGLSGLLGTALGWQFLFFSVVPIGIIAWLLMYCNVRCDWKDAPDDPFDWRGASSIRLPSACCPSGRSGSFPAHGRASCSPWGWCSSGCSCGRSAVRTIPSWTSPSS
mgnify:CR=1 FL=1